VGKERGLLIKGIYCLRVEHIQSCMENSQKREKVKVQEME
jgi:hypothetical protein